MSQVLSLSMRPRKLSEVIGQKSLVASLRKQMLERPPRAIMLCGGTGSGKTTLARIIAISLQCSHQEIWGDPCPECWKKELDFTIQEINASDINGVEEIGVVAQASRHLPLPPSRQRVIILDEAQRITSAAQNLLLKPTEDAPETTTWIICTTEPNKILATLRRRFVIYNLSSLGPNGRVALLQRAVAETKLKRPIEELESKLEEYGITSPALVLMAFEKFASGLTATDSVSGETSGTDSFSICKAVSSGNWRSLRALLQQAQPEEARWIRASVGGWLRGILWRETNPTKQAALAKSIKELADGRAPLDDSMLMLWLIATLHDICKRFGA